MSSDGKKTKAEQLKVIKRGRGIQYILDEAYKILGNPILIHDMEYKHIASSNCSIDDDPYWNEFMKYGGLTAELIEFTKNEGFIDSVANSTLQDGVTYLISDKLKYNRIFGQLYNKKRVPVADLVVVECDSPFEDSTPENIRVVCDVLTKELGASEYYQDYGQTYKESIIKKLIEGSIEDNKLYTGHIANIDTMLKKNIFVGVADIGRCNAEHGGLVEVRDFLNQKQPDFEYYVYNNSIVILMSCDSDKPIPEKKSVVKLRKWLESENIYVGASRCFENLFELRKYYEEAVRALNRGLSEDSSSRFFFYSD